MIKITVDYRQGAISIPKPLGLPACLMCVWHPVHSTISTGIKKSSYDWVWGEKDHSAALSSKSVQIKRQLEAKLNAAYCTHNMSSSLWDIESSRVSWSLPWVS